MRAIAKRLQAIEASTAPQAEQRLLQGVFRQYKALGIAYLGEIDFIGNPSEVIRCLEDWGAPDPFTPDQHKQRLEIRQQVFPDYQDPSQLEW